MRQLLAVVILVAFLMLLSYVFGGAVIVTALGISIASATVVALVFWAVMSLVDWGIDKYEG